MMESMENWHAEHIELPVRLESFWRLSEKASVIDVFDIPLRGGATLRPEVPTVWVEAYDLVGEKMLWVPYECATMNTVVKFAMTLTFYTSSNGLASGNHMLEAINHALFEVIERDSHAEWLDRPREARLRTKIDPSSIADIECRTILERFDAARVDVAIWDATSEAFGIPVYLAQVVDRDVTEGWRRVGVVQGRGCHLSPGVALSRALCEAAQSRLTIISGSRDDNPLATYEAIVNESLISAWIAEYFAPSAILPFERADSATQSFEGDLQEILTALRRKGVKEAAIVDLSQPDIGIPVVKAVVLGLQIADEGGGRAPAPAGRKR
jgi:ribosomal protein S12 methylthiotransferase accessory factor